MNIDADILIFFLIGLSALAPFLGRWIVNGACWVVSEIFYFMNHNEEHK